MDKQDGARLMTIEEGNRLSSLLGITAVSSDFSLTDGTLSLSLEFTKDVTEVKTTVSELNDRVTNIEESITWEIL